jgi:ubiquinol-cytochrome c reductase cytochrome c1 subunit
MPPKKMEWSFDGPFGVYDRAALQRGFQVYKEVCSACHSLGRVAFRNLGEKGGPEFSEKQVAAIAAGYKVPADPDEQGKTVDANGQPLTRPAVASDYFPPPFPNEKATRAAMNGALPPDLSLIVKAREGGPDYVYGILTGFKQAPADFKMQTGMNYSEYFPGHQIAMPPPLTTDGQLTYADGTKATVQQMAHDVTTFLSWAAEPNLNERHRMGAKVILFLVIAAGIFYATKRRVWASLHGHGGGGGHGQAATQAGDDD